MEGESEQQFLTPLPAHPIHPVDPVANSNKLDLEQHSITFNNFWLLWGPPKLPQNMFLTNTPQLLATLATPKRANSLLWANTPSLLATLGIPKQPKSLLLTNTPSLFTTWGTRVTKKHVFSR